MDERKAKSEFRAYRAARVRDAVKKNYYLNHVNQTVDFVKRKQQEYLTLNQQVMSIWEAMEKLDCIVDDSDPDTINTQIMHALQTAEAIRADGHPRWMILTGLIHDLGKVLCLYGEPQWAVVGDTFPVGCRFSENIVYPEFFKDNPDSHNPKYQSKFGIYTENCGLDNVMMSWGHDEYLYYVVKDYLPEESLYIIRYHSFYACHRHNDYQYLMNQHDINMFEWVKKFNPYDLYTKSDAIPDIEKLAPYYHDLVNEFIPKHIRW